MRWISSIYIWIETFVRYTFVMGKGIEAILTMICTYTAISYTTKGQIGVCQVHYCIINTTTTKGNTIYYFIYCFRIGRKDIQG